MTSSSFDPYEWHSFYFAGMGRDEAVSLLSQPLVALGTFILRDSSHAGGYSLSVRESDEDAKVRHYLIEKRTHAGVDGFKIASQFFTGIPPLLNHYKMRILDKTSLTQPYRKSKIERVVAVYRFEAEREGELSFETGEELEVIDKPEGGWWQARNALNVTGLIPENFVSHLEDNEDRTSRGRSQSSLESVDESSRLSGVSTNSEAERYEPELPATAKVIMDLVPNVYDSTKLRLTKGQEIRVLRKLTNGIFEAVVDGRTGSIPFTYVRFVKPA